MKAWTEIMNLVELSVYENVSKFYSREEGWLYITMPYRNERIRYDRLTNPGTVREMLELCRQHYKTKQIK